MFISVVIPVHNEVESLKELDYRLHNALKEEKIINDYQLIYVDDGSNDGSNKLLNQLVDNSKSFFNYFKSQFRKIYASSSGISKSRRRILSDDRFRFTRFPEDIPLLLENMLSLIVM